MLPQFQNIVREVVRLKMTKPTALEDGTRSRPTTDWLDK